MTPRDVDDASLTVLSAMEARHWYRVVEPEPAPAPVHYKEVLQMWGGSWMWEDTTLSEELSWLADAMHNGTLVGVSDGS